MVFALPGSTLNSMQRALSDADIAFSPVNRQVELLRDGVISAVALTEIYLERIGRLDRTFNAYRVVRAEAARAEARAAQERLDRGDRAPMLGVPVAVKDVIDVAGETTSHGTAAVSRVAERDAEAVTRLRAAGAVLLGKTTTPELAMWPHMTESKTYGATRNPWNPERSTGGSSGGSAAAVAAALAAVAVGTDGGASIRVPAAMCGIFGIKPQRGRVPVAGGEHWYGLTQWGPLARTVADAALLLDVLAGPQTDLRDPGVLRIGVLVEPEPPYARLEPDQRTAVDLTAEVLRGRGHDVRVLEPSWGQSFAAAVALAALPRYLGGIAHDAATLDHPERLESRSRHMVRLGRWLQGQPLRRSCVAEPRLADRLNRPFEEVDLLLTPVFPKPAPRISRWAGAGAVRTFIGCTPWIWYTPPWNLTGQPAASVPAGFDDEGLPLAVQLVGRPGDEATVLAVAAQLEAARPWAEHRPPSS